MMKAVNIHRMAAHDGVVGAKITVLWDVHDDLWNSVYLLTCSGLYDVIPVISEAGTERLNVNLLSTGEPGHSRCCPVYGQLIEPKLICTASDSIIVKSDVIAGCSGRGKGPIIVDGRNTHKSINRRRPVRISEANT